MSEPSNRRIRQDILLGLKLGALMIVAALLLAWARREGWIDQMQVVRAFNIVLGLGFAAYSNLLPKMYGPAPRSLRQATLAQAVRRVTSWSMTLAFLVWTVLWIFAPQSLARIASVAAVLTAMAISLCYLVWKAAGCHASKSG